MQMCVPPSPVAQVMLVKLLNPLLASRACKRRQTLQRHCQLHAQALWGCCLQKHVQGHEQLHCWNWASMNEQLAWSCCHAGGFTISSWVTWQTLPHAWHSCF